MKTGLRRLLALALGAGLLTANTYAAATTFTDVPTTYWGYYYIDRAATEGLVSGIGDNQYGPEQTLSNAQFVTMICNMFYKTAVAANQNSSGQWWYPYMAAAYSAGILSNTTVAQRRAAAGGWTEAMVNAEISRYDMAQIMVNVAGSKGWENPSALDLMAARISIKDWSTIPSNYQNAVAGAYARKLLSGDENGNFNGAASTTRAQAAVVLCSLYDASTTIQVPTYVNSNRLVSGKTPSESNVYDDLVALKSDYPENYLWDMTRSYTSKELGTATGVEAFAYMLSDKVFGAMAASKLKDPADLRVGDVVSFDSGSDFGVVVSVDRNDFTYVTCDNSGWITWKETADLDDLDSRDTVYTRYLTKASGDDTLSNGEKATESNVEDLLDDLMDDYEDGDDWDMSDRYTSNVFGSAKGDEAFAYTISDEIFDELDYKSVKYAEDLRAGDVIYDSWNELWGVVVDVDTKNEVCTYGSIDSKDRIAWDFEADFDDLDEMYTRYPSSSSSSSDDELTNGKSITESNVEKYLSEFEDDRDYGDGKEWDDDDEDFAWSLSDEIFGDVDYTKHSKTSKLKIGDIIYDDDEGLYGVVIDIDEDRERAYYVSVYSDGEIDWNFWTYFDDITTIYTRYPDSTSSDDTLSNGKKVNESNVEALLEKKLKDIDSWDMKEYYDSKVFGDDLSGAEGFAWMLSDKVFGNLDYERLSDKKELQAGDVIEFKDDDSYGVVTDSQGDSDYDFFYVTVNSKGRIQEHQRADYEDIYRVYTRYPD